MKLMTVALFIIGALINGITLTLAQNAKSVRIDPPDVIVANKGQWKSGILYGDMLGRYAFTREGILLSRPASSLSVSQLKATDIPRLEIASPRFLRFVNASNGMCVHGGEATGGNGQMYIGSDSMKWRSDLPVLSSVIYENVWDSIDVEYHERNGRPAMTLRLRPGAVPADVAMENEAGAGIVQLDPLGGSDGLKGFTSMVNANNMIYTIRGVNDTIRSTTEFVLYFGGIYSDCLGTIIVRDDGSIYLGGYTNSGNFLATGNNQGVFAMHLGCDGRSVLYSTVYSSDSGWRDLTNGGDHIPMCIRRNRNVVLAGSAPEKFEHHIPLTPDALEKPCYTHTPGSAFFFELDSTGHLHYATLFGQICGRWSSARIGSLAMDNHDQLAVMGYQCCGFPYITSNTADPRDSANGDFVVKLSSTLNTVLWGTRVGGFPEGSCNHFLSLTFDSTDNIIVMGEIGTTNTIPLINAAITERQWCGLYLQKLTPNGKNFIFSTYIGGHYQPGTEGHEGTYMAHPYMDAGDGIHIVGYTGSEDFPVVGSTRSYAKRCDGFYMNLSSDGRLLRSFCLGGSDDDFLRSMDFDAAGNMYVLGNTYSHDFPLVNTLETWNKEPYEGGYTTLSVFKSGTDSLMFSTLWHDDIGQNFINLTYGCSLLQVRPTGYVVFGGSALQNHPEEGHADFFLNRMFLPFCGQDFLSTSLTIHDSLWLETSHNGVNGSLLTVHVGVDNPSVKDTAYYPDVSLVLPAGCSLDPPTQSLSRHIGTIFPPGAHAEYEWTVRVDTITAADSLFAIRAVVEYDLEPNPPSCERPFVRGTGYVPVHRYESPKPVYTCTIEVPDTLSVSADSLTNNPFPVRCHIRNTGQSTFTLSGLRLVLPTGSPAALELVPAGDSLRPGGTLAQGEEMVRDWTVKALYFPNTCERVIKLVVIDTFGYRLPGCEKSIVIPGLKRTVCAITATDTVAYNTAQSLYLPSPLNVDLIVSSDLDTTLAGVTARLDLAHASHLRLVTGDSSNRSLPSISAHGSMGARWRLEVIPHPSGPVSDTLFVYHRAPGWTEERWCMHVIRIIPPVKDVSCTLGAPVVAVTATNTYSPDTAVVKWIVMNNGAIAVSGLTAHLDMSCDPAWCLDALDRSVGIVQPSGQDSITWRLVPKTSAFERDISLRVTARDSLGTEITSCDAVLQLPRIYLPLRCTLACPDTLHYMSQTDSYEPDPFNATVTVENLVDTAMTAMAQLDLSGASHLKLAPNETGQAVLGIVQPHGTAQHSFSVAVSTPADQTSSEDIAVNAEGLFSTTQLESVCTTPTVMQPRPSIHTAECFTAGHDTVWADPVLEDLIPHPIQIRNGIINTGNDPLENCEAAIIVPDGYILAQPPDSIQKYAPIAPGDTGRREWLLEVDRNHPTPDLRTVRFAWHCDSGVQGECTRDVVLKASSPQGLVLSKWRLLFSAEMSSTIPPAQKVSVWTGGNAPFAWQPLPDVSWLSATPSVLGGSGTIDIVPTTTAMSVGTYEGIVSIVTSEWAQPVPIEISYEIWIKSDAKPIPTPSGMWLECVPNPARPGGTLHIRYSVDKPGAVRIRLMDALGREVNSEYREAFSTAEQQTTLSLPSTLVSGAYFIVLERAVGRVVKGVVIR